MPGESSSCLELTLASSSYSQVKCGRPIWTTHGVFPCSSWSQTSTSGWGIISHHDAPGSSNAKMTQWRTTTTGSWTAGGNGGLDKGLTDGFDSPTAYCGRTCALCLLPSHWSGLCSSFHASWRALVTAWEPSVGTEKQWPLHLRSGGANKSSAWKSLLPKNSRRNNFSVTQNQKSAMLQ